MVVDIVLEKQVARALQILGRIVNTAEQIYFPVRLAAVLNTLSSPVCFVFILELTVVFFILGNLFVYLCYCHHFVVAGHPTWWDKATKSNSELV